MGAARQAPTDDHDAIIQLWTVIIGTNGHGMASKIESMERRLSNSVTRQECKATRGGVEKRRRSAWLAIKDAVLLVLAAGGFIFGSGVIG